MIIFHKNIKRNMNLDSYYEHIFIDMTYRFHNKFVHMESHSEIYQISKFMNLLFEHI